MFANYVTEPTSHPCVLFLLAWRTAKFRCRVGFGFQIALMFGSTWILWVECISVRNWWYVQKRSWAQVMPRWQTDEKLMEDFPQWREKTNLGLSVKRFYTKKGKHSSETPLQAMTTENSWGSCKWFFGGFITSACSQPKMGFIGVPHACSGLKVGKFIKILINVLQWSNLTTQPLSYRK